MDGTIIVADCAGEFKTIDGRLLYSKKDEEDKKAVAATLGKNIELQHNGILVVRDLLRSNCQRGK